MFSKRSRSIPTACFLLIECVLYYFVLTAGGETFTVCAYTGIVLCFLFALLSGVKNDPLIVAGLACTVGADFCLVVCSPIQQLWGMVFFLGAQMLYAIHMHRRQNNNVLLLIRILLTVAVEILAVLILKDNLDALAMFSMAYYANLIMNMVVAFTQWRRNKLLPIGFVLFILCDTIIGLQVASSGYLPIAEGSLLYNLIFSGFNTAWMFYLPSQVLIALCCLRKGDTNGRKNAISE